MLILYDFGNSVCCQKVRITLRAKGLDWEARRVDLFKSEQYDPKYLKMNPKGVVPTLVHDGRPVIESTLICEYIDETFPGPPLIPNDAYGRTRMRLWGKFVDEGLHNGVTELSFSAMFRQRMRDMTEAQRQTRFRNVGDPRRTDRFKSTYELGAKSPFVTQMNSPRCARTGRRFTTMWRQRSRGCGSNDNRRHSGTARSAGPGIQIQMLSVPWIPGSRLRRAPE